MCSDGVIIYNTVNHLLHAGIDTLPVLQERYDGEEGVELVQGNLSDFLGVTRSLDNVDKVVFAEYYPYGTVSAGTRTPLYPKDAAGLVNKVLSSNPEVRVTVVVGVRMVGREEGRRIFFNTIDCPERVDFVMNR